MVPNLDDLNLYTSLGLLTVHYIMGSKKYFFSNAKNNQTVSVSHHTGKNIIFKYFLTKSNNY